MKVTFNAPVAESKLWKVSALFNIAHSIVLTHGELTREQKIKLKTDIEQICIDDRANIANILQVDISELPHKEDEFSTYLKQTTEHILLCSKQIEEIRRETTRNIIKYVKQMVRISNLTENICGTNRSTFCRYLTHDVWCGVTYDECLSEL